ncbi:hypothetical protein [Fusobacterium hwasookii]|uniref:hypothetical protein n=1 Tax=Fusobacterium hwasookii TaxID=1583098 RepID=UPI0004B156E9|nr:hypothetical protein [Fusobacterium hwasookii]
MIVEEREMILNLSYEELIEKFKNEPQKVIKFLHEEQKKDVGNDTEYIIEKLITLIIIIIEDYYLEDDSFNELLIELAYNKRHHNHEDLAFLLEKKHSPN